MKRTKCDGLRRCRLAAETTEPIGESGVGWWPGHAEGAISPGADLGRRSARELWPAGHLTIWAYALSLGLAVMFLMRAVIPGDMGRPIRKRVSETAARARQAQPRQCLSTSVC